ncbi:hypothetical protein [Acidaminobacter sp.]|nr:hypothetical protein [Acidaminobacter sp.]
MKVRHTIDYNGNLISQELLSEEESPNTDHEDYVLKQIEDRE